MAIEDTKVEDLGVSAGAVGWGDLIRSPALPCERHGSPFGESWYLNGAGLERIFIIGSRAPRQGYAKVVLRALQRYAHYRHVAVRADDSCRRATVPVRLMGRTLIAWKLVVESRARIWVQRGRGNVRNEVLVKAPSLAGGRLYRGGEARGAIAGEAGNRRPSSGFGETD